MLAHRTASSPLLGLSEIRRASFSPVGEQKSTTRRGLATKGRSCTPALQTGGQEQQHEHSSAGSGHRHPLLQESRNSLTQLGARLLLVLKGQAGSQPAWLEAASSPGGSRTILEHHRDALGLPLGLPPQHKAQGEAQGSWGSSFMTWWELSLSGYSLPFHTGESSSSRSHHTNTTLPAQPCMTHTVSPSEGSAKVPKAHTAQGGLSH